MLEELLKTLRLLASPPEAALAWLHEESQRIGGNVALGVDEIALDFDNWARASWQLVESGQLTEATQNAILALLDVIESIESHPAEWTPAAFTASEKWARVRMGAATILKRIELDQQRP